MSTEKGESMFGEALNRWFPNRQPQTQPQPQNNAQPRIVPTTQDERVIITAEGPVNEEDPDTPIFVG